MIEQIAGTGIVLKERDGFFQTPERLASSMVAMAFIRPGMSILEPSAGLGAILDVLTRMHPDCDLLAIEKNKSRAQELTEKGYETICCDFLQFADQPENKERFDRVIQNPPFENLQDTEHVKAAWEVLKPDGNIVSIISPGSMFNERAQGFRDWLENTAKHFIISDVAAGTFKESGTNVKSHMLWIKKINNEPENPLKGLPLFEMIELAGSAG